MVDVRIFVLLLPALAYPQAEIAPSSSTRAVDTGGELTVEGRVIYEDETPAGAGVDIRSCAPPVKSGADSRFTISKNNPPTPCVITATKPGFKSSEFKIMVNSGAIDIGDLTLRAVKDLDAPPPRSPVSNPSLDAPEPAWKAFEKGRRAAERKKWKDAEKRLRTAVEIYPRFAQAWTVLGNVYRDTERSEEARAAYEKAVEADPAYAPPKLGLAALAVNAENWKEAEIISTKIIRDAPTEFPDAYMYRAMALFSTGQYQAATEAAYRGVEIDTRKQFPQIQHLLGTILARQGRYADALIHLRNFLNYGAGPDAPEIRKQIAAVEAQAKKAR